MAIGKSPFPELPLEIRRLIYGFLFASSPIIPYQEIGYSNNRDRQALNIILVNHQIRTDVSDVFYSEGRLVVEISERRLDFLSLLISTQNYSHFRAPKSTHQVKHVIIEVYIDIKTPDSGSANLRHQAPWILDNMRSICHALSTNSILQTLELGFWHYNTISDW